MVLGESPRLGGRVHCTISTTPCYHIIGAVGDM
jgi:hypothetical protein